jgi:hypothetical protein
MGQFLKGTLNLSKIKKDKKFKLKNGNECINITVWLNDKADDFGNIASVQQDFKEGDSFQKVYIGNLKNQEQINKEKCQKIKKGETMKFKYREVINMGFEIIYCKDRVYFDQYGYDYYIITKELNRAIYLEWAKETQKMNIVRIDKDSNIKAKEPIVSHEQLEFILRFFTDKI